MGTRTVIQLLLSVVFLVVNVGVLLAILWLNRRKSQNANTRTSPETLAAGKQRLDASDILEWEFEYARTTASEAMEQRHTMVNFYLLAAGVVISGVVAVLSQEASLPKAVGTVLLWLLCGIGWVYYLALIRLRQAWFDSAKAMSQIKDFYIQNTAGFSPEALRTAFRWRSETLPQPDKPWTVHFFSAMLIALLDSVAFTAGGLLLYLGAPLHLALLTFVLLPLFGMGYFAFHVWLYFAFLKPDPPDKVRQDRDNTENNPMQDTSPSSQDPDAWVQIESEQIKYAFGKLFRIVEARLRYRRFDGQMSKPVTRVNFERGEAVGVLLYDPKRDAVVLVRQFRYPVYAGLSEEERQREGVRQAWILEVVAGIREGDQSALKTVQRELLEEAGYTIQGDLQFIATLYPSPGGSSERIHLYWGEVDAAETSGTGGGLEIEGEDTQVVVLPFQEAIEMVGRGEIQDAKTILALQHLALLKTEAQ